MRRTARLELFLNVEEKAAFAALAAALGVPVATWARLQLRELAKAELAKPEPLQGPAAPKGRATVDDFLDVRTARWEDGARRFAPVELHLTDKGLTPADAPEAHALYEAAARAHWTPRYMAMRPEHLRDYYAYLSDCERRIGR